MPPLLHVDSQSSTQSYCLFCGSKTNSHIYGSLGAKQCLAGSESLTFKQLRITSGITATWPLLHLQNKWNLPWNKDDSKQYKQMLQRKKVKKLRSKLDVSLVLTWIKQTKRQLPGMSLTPQYLKFWPFAVIVPALNPENRRFNIRSCFNLMKHFHTSISSMYSLYIFSFLSFPWHFSIEIKFKLLQGSFSRWTAVTSKMLWSEKDL